MVDFGTGEVDNGENNDIIESRAKDNFIQLPNGKMNGSKPRNIRISKSEYTRVTHQFATDFPNCKINSIRGYYNRDYYYVLKVNAFGDYDFLDKIVINRNEANINDIERMIKNADRY